MQGGSGAGVAEPAHGVCAAGGHYTLHRALQPSNDAEEDEDQPQRKRQALADECAATALCSPASPCSLLLNAQLQMEL